MAVGIDLSNKIALVTGGGQGIGFAIARRLGQSGATVLIADINEEIGNKAVSDLAAEGIKSEFYMSNAASFEDVNNTISKILDKHNVIDILVNNAGITRDQLLIKMTEADWDAVLAVNLKGTFNFTKALYRSMMKQKSGRMINIASIIGIIGNAGQANYAASKAGIIGFTKSVARELGPRGICVNAIAPGFIKTAMTDVLKDDVKQKMLEQIPLKELGSVEDVANAVLFLASDLSRYITGHVVNVSGGMVM